MTLKPILVKSAEYSDIQLGMTGELHLEDGTSFALRKYQHIILIDTEAEIVKDDLFVDTKTNVIHIASDSHVTWENEFKVISSTNKSHNLPQLSNESKQLLINYYSEHKCRPESVKVKHKLDRHKGKDIISATWERQYGTDTMRVGEKNITRIVYHKKKYDFGTACWAMGFDKDDKLVEQFGDSRTVGKYRVTISKTVFTQSLKLNQQGEVDITIPEVEEKVYTVSEVKTLCKKAMYSSIDDCIISTEAGNGLYTVLDEKEFEKWFDKNKK